ncbi:hypothetical protein [Notoacmeibacter ruber]|uniref:DUF1311 domain-containing protein n=1 Tax=Notoacmeibacter ruber TaxID=2670375 RepID=A0A3L7J391_9HYPH|nr:hypothetical protein [Notoacmeibacter ruber]RLQ84964.1 hypothetical protein D8780_15360 [Notoacmeibacter ruber]
MKPLILTLAVLIAAPNAAAARDDFMDFTITMERTYRVCPDRPKEPKWEGNQNIKAAWKGILLQKIYEIQSYEAVIQNDDCSCEVRFPKWNRAMQVYTENFSELTYRDGFEVEDKIRARAKALRGQAKAICDRGGLW